MTDFTDEEMLQIILRSLNENAPRMRRKLKRQRARAAAREAVAVDRNPNDAAPALPATALGRSSE